MSTPAINTVAWFEVATDDPDGAQRFYGDLFGWRFAPFAGSEALGMDYRLIRYGEDAPPQGGVYGTGGDRPNHAIFVVRVADVTATCERAERLGGKVINKIVGNEVGPEFAYLRDVSGNVFGVFRPRPA
jgi:Predicted enzyme related to lactoylglutathione lyase